MMDLNEYMRQTLPPRSEKQCDEAEELFTGKLFQLEDGDAKKQEAPSRKHLDILRGFGPRKVCQYQFKKNDIVWICRQCQRDETCVQCNECFQKADHQGHEVFFYHSHAGGCCDCGDAGAWSSSGFCSLHGHSPFLEPAAMLPAGVARQAAELLPQASNALSVFCFQYEQLFTATGSAGNNNNSAHVIRIHADDMHSSQDREEIIRTVFPSEIIGAVFASEATPARALAEMIRLKGYADIEVPITAPAQTSDLNEVYLKPLRDKEYTACILPNHVEVAEQWVLFLSQWLLRLAQASDSMLITITQIFIRHSTVPSLLRHFSHLSRPLTDRLHSLLVALVADMEFKRHVTIAYAEAYSSFATHFSRGVGQPEHSAFSVSVQFLNRVELVTEAVTKHALYPRILESLSAMLTSCTLHSNPLQALVIKYKRYVPVIGDLKIMFHLPVASRLFLTQCREKWLDILASLSWLHPQKRQLDQHVERESNDWISAFNLIINVAATYQPLLGWADSSPSEGKIFASVDTTDHTYIYGSLKLESESLIDFVDMDGTKKQLSPMLLRDLLTTTLERLEVWCGDFIRSNCRDDCIALPCSMSVEIPKASSTSSFHLPLHRFLVTIISAGLRSRNHNSTVREMIKDLECIASTRIMTLADGPLNCMVFAAQVHQRLWVRNGSVMGEQLLNYSELPICRSFRDLDLLLLQTCGAALGSAEPIIAAIISRFNLTGLLRVLHDDPRDSTLLEDALILILQLMAELPLPAESEASILLRRELIQRLAAGPATFSELHDHAARTCDFRLLPAGEIDRIVAAVSISRRASPLEPLKQVLRPDCWVEYDPSHIHLSFTSHQTAVESRPKVESIQPYIPKPLPCHSIYTKFRLSLADSNIILFSLLRTLTLVAAKQRIGSSSSGDVSQLHSKYSSINFLDVGCASAFPRVLQLLTLIAHLLTDIREEAQKKKLDPSLKKQFQLNDGIFATFILQQTDVQNSNNSKAPHLLESLIDILETLKDSSENNMRQWILWVIQEFGKASDACGEYVHARLSAKEAERHAKDSESRKKRAREKAIAAMQLSSKSFAASMNTVDDDSDEESALPATQSPRFDDVAPECIICQQRGKIGLETGFLAYCQASSILSRAQKSPPTLHLPNPYEQILEAPVRAHVSFCSHAMHDNCLKRYVAIEYERVEEYDMRHLFDHTKGEFLCPFCKRLGNVLVYHNSVTSMPIRPPNQPAELTLINLSLTHTTDTEFVNNQPLISSSASEMLISPTGSLCNESNNNATEITTNPHIPVAERIIVGSYDMPYHAKWKEWIVNMNSPYKLHEPEKLFNMSHDLILCEDNQLSDQFLKLSATVIYTMRCQLVRNQMEVVENDNDCLVVCLILRSLSMAVKYSGTSRQIQDSVELLLGDQHDHIQRSPLVLPILEVACMCIAISYTPFLEGNTVGNEKLQESCDKLLICCRWLSWVSLAQLALKECFDANDNTSYTLSEGTDCKGRLETSSGIRQIVGLVYSVFSTYVKARFNVTNGPLVTRVTMTWTNFLKELTHLLQSCGFLQRATSRPNLSTSDNVWAETVYFMEVLGLNNAFLSDGTVVPLLQTRLTTWVAFICLDMTSDGMNIPSATSSSNFNNYLLPLELGNLCSNPSLLSLPHAYSQFHAQVTALTDYGHPGICMRCGAVLDAEGKGLCCAHVGKCGFGTGIVFLLQDHYILLVHGKRCCYLPAPYVDEYGESARNSRGRPLTLDKARCDALLALWLEHRISQEISNKRSTSSHIIISNYY